MTRFYVTADPAWIIPVRKETVNNVGSIVLEVDLFHTEEGETFGKASC